MTKKDDLTTMEIKKLNKQLKDLDNKFKRVLADYQNQSKRFTSRQADIIKYANEGLLDKLLPILDSLLLAQTHLKDSGLKMIVNQFTQVLELEGVKKIDSNHQPFNPETMDCAHVVSGPKNQVINTLVAGYTYHDKVLRPAKVEVGSGHQKTKK